MSPMKFKAQREKVIGSPEALESLLSKERDLSCCTFRGFDFSDRIINWQNYHIADTVFLGCNFSLEQELLLRRMGAWIYTAPEGLPYQPFRVDLYSWQELMDGYHPAADNSVDLKIYDHFSRSRFNPGINEALWQRIHDHAIDNALRNLLGFNDEGMTGLKCVGIMGGHGIQRTDSYFIKTAHTARLLTEAGYFVCTGGGPGIMEAGNLGAYFGGRPAKDLNAALDILSVAPHYTSKGYHSSALEVLTRFPDGAQSLAVPTWFYGHEPSNIFASHIAKYFSNSLREDTLISISLYGIVFAPGSAGTTQEIFMDATQNHYGTFNYYSPMIFLGKERYEIETLIFPLLKQLSWQRPYHDLLHITDAPEDIVSFIAAHPPVKYEVH